MRSTSSLTSSSLRSSVLMLAPLLACSSGGDTTAVGSADGTLAGAPAAPLGGAQQAELDRYIGDALGRYHVPGAAVAIVRGRDVVYRQTFGVRSVTTGEPVTPHTLFGVASVTKSMTSLMLASLVDDGKLRWDEPARDILPAFALSSAASTAQIRVRDLVNGTSGVPRFDTPLLVRSFSPTELIGLVQTIPTVAAPGEVFGYSNAMVAIGGYAGAVADGAGHESSELTAGYLRSIEERVLSPIGMASTLFDLDAALAQPDHARPHSYDAAQDAIVETPVEFERSVASLLPAGGAWSSIDDMAAYASTQLSGVAPSGRRVVSPENLEATHTEAISDIPPEEWPTPDRQGAGYAMGWFTMPSYQGMRALSHDGNLLGYTSEVLLLPDAQLAVVILCNASQANAFYGAVEQFAVETALSLEHQGDALQLESQRGFVEQLRDVAALSSPISRERAEPLLGRYEQNVSVDFTEQGLSLQTELGSIPLASYADSGVFIRTGALLGRLVAAFDSELTPTQVTLGLPGGEGLSQPFVLQRLGD